MTATQTDQPVTLVFKDQAGDYYLLPREVMERHRVPAEQKAEVEQSLAGAAPTGGGGADDTGAFALPAIFFVGLAIGVAAGSVGTATTVVIADKVLK
jgi:hypothetical protein